MDVPFYDFFQQPPRVLEHVKFTCRTEPNDQLQPLPLPRPHERGWSIKKILKASDVGDHHRLIIDKKNVREHIHPFLGPEDSEAVERSKKIKVMIRDIDTSTDHEVVFAKLTKVYVFQTGWVQHFVKRRELREGCEIGMYCDTDIILFSVLGRPNGDQDSNMQ